MQLILARLVAKPCDFCGGHDNGNVILGKMIDDNL